MSVCRLCIFVCRKYLRGVLFFFIALIGININIVDVKYFAMILYMLKGVYFPEIICRTCFFLILFWIV